MLSIVIPAHLEEKRIGKPLRRLVAFLEKKGIRHELIVVTNAKDATGNTAKQVAPRAKVIELPRPGGKGTALMVGLRKAKGRICMVYDADGATPPEEIPKALDALKEADVVIGTRTFPQRPWYRQIVSRAFWLMTRYLFGLPYTDTQCGFKLFHAIRLKSILHATHSKNLEWDVEFLWRCKNARLWVRELPVRWKSVPGGPIEADKLKNLAQLFWDMIELRLRL